MVTIQECRAALDRLPDGLASTDGGLTGVAGLNHSLSCRVTDLGVTFTGRLGNGRTEAPDAVVSTVGRKAQIRLTITGDGLVELASGELNFTRA